MNILGINGAYHESAACIMHKGRIIAAGEEERFNRVKHGKPARIDNPHLLPLNAINYCLSEAQLSLTDVDHIGFSFEPEKRLKNKDFSDPTTPGSWGTNEGELLFYNRINEIPSLLRQLGFKGHFHWLSHHLCHAASAAFVSGFPTSAILILDGIGEMESTSLEHFDSKKITPLLTIDYPHSLGFLWEYFCQFLGFSEYDACKVMGLASYGDQNRYLPQFQQLVLHNEKGFRFLSNFFSFRKPDFANLEHLFNLKAPYEKQFSQEHYDLAAGLQKITSLTIVHLAKLLKALSGSDSLCMAGGVALNCVANDALLREGLFKDIFIQPAAHDAGTALGAAILLASQHDPSYIPSPLPSIYLGPQSTDSQIQQALEAHNLKYTLSSHIASDVAQLLAKGNIIGWFQGRMELGPRALGNRSLLADPRLPNIREIMNVKVKHRETFRPFSPSILSEAFQDWFEVPYHSSISDYMLSVYTAHPHKKHLIPAVLHIDGTGRAQTVTKEKNPLYYTLIKEFEKLTAIPMVLNTSFNDSEPIVCTPDDAIRTFLSTEIDWLAIGPYLVNRTK